MNKDVSNLSKLFITYNQATGKDEPVVLSEGQKEIFNTIVQRSHPRTHCMTVTQYGKSFTVAAAVTARVMTHPEKWAIVAPSEPKSMIIMRYIIEFCDKNPVFKSMLDMEEGAKDRLRREISKKRIVFKNGAEVFILSADSKNKVGAGEALMGFGSPNIILDESSLIDDEIYSKVFRMLGGHKDNLIFEIGNPFNRNHFLESYHNPKYQKILIDSDRAVAEGRMMPDFVEEMRNKANFDILYKCKFPPQDMIDYNGWTTLIAEDKLTGAMVGENPNTFGEARLGVDIARSGGNFNVWVLRHDNYARVLGKTTTDNLMDVIGMTKTIADEHNIPDNRIYIDATGMGAGVYDRFTETGWNVRGVNLAESASDPDKYINIRAEGYLRLREWLMGGGTLDKDSDFLQLLNIKYKTRSNGKIQIIDKDQLRKDGIASPDVADALMLTFVDSSNINTYQRKIKVITNQRNQPRYE